MNDVKLCINCKYLMLNGNFGKLTDQVRHGLCAKTGSFSFVDGSQNNGSIMASLCRGSADYCGTEAKWFEQKRKD